jgi:hypothetical protein
VTCFHFPHGYADSLGLKSLGTSSHPRNLGTTRPTRM